MYSVVEFAAIVDPAHRALVNPRDGTLITRSAIRVISNVIRDSLVHCATEHTGHTHTGKWFNAVLVAGNIIYIYIFMLAFLPLTSLFYLKKKIMY